MIKASCNTEYEGWSKQGVCFPKEMWKYCGLECRVKSVLDHDDNNEVTTYVLENIEQWNWLEEWLYDLDHQILDEDLFKI